MPYGGGMGGDSGMSGMVMSLPEHHEELVTVVKEKKARNRDINIVSPFAGKTFCFGEWKKSLGKLPLDRGHVVMYDNSNDPAFSRRLQKFCESELDSYKLVKDTNAQLTLELSNDWTAIGKRCRAVYGIIYNQLIDHSKPLSLNLEDDIGVPDGAWERLMFHAEDDEVGTVIAKCYDRRSWKRDKIKQAISVNFKVTEMIGPSGVAPEIELVHLEEKDFGVESIGAGHMGLWLTKTDVIKDLGMGHQFANLVGNDINWGYAVNQAGLRFVQDWGVKLDHYYKSDSGKKLSC